MESIFKTQQELGKQSPLTLDQGAEQLIDVALAIGEPRALTLALGVTQPVGAFYNYNAAPPSAELVATIQYGGRNAPAFVDVDMVDGLILSLVASHLVVSARFAQFDPSDPPIAGSAYLPMQSWPLNPMTVRSWWWDFKPTVLASVAEGVVAHGRAPQRTLQTFAPLAPGANRTWKIPALAQSLRLLGTPGASALQVNVRSYNSFRTLSGVTVTALPGREIELPTGAYDVNITNVGVVPVTALGLLFPLAL